MASELDVLPTAASLAGLPYVNSTLGRDLLDPAFDDRRYAFTIGDQGKVPMARARREGPRVRGLRRRFEPQAHRARTAATPRANLAAREPETAARMEELCRALYETARYLPFVNAPGKVRDQAED